MRLFIDSSILFAACHSARGGARELIRQAILGRVALCVSDYVFDETAMSIEERAPRVLPLFLYLRGRSYWRLISITQTDVVAAIGVTTDRFDAPIVAAAKAANVDFLVSFDRKHLHTPAVAAYVGCPVVVPAQVLSQLRTDLPR